MFLVSPAHRALSGQLALISVTGRRTGRQYTFPVSYKRDGERVRIPVGWSERKVWWRNLLDGAPVRVRLAGQERTGTAQVHRDERNGVSVEVVLDPRA
jgi:F420H(2)-dependent quinone reductase